MGVWIMAGVTFREAARKKILWMAAAAGAGFLLLFGVGLHYQVRDLAVRTNPLVRRQILYGAMMVGLYAADALAVVMAALTSVDTLSGEIASGAIQAIVTKPVDRWQIILGKWIGFAAMMTLYVFFIMGGVIAVSNFVAHVSPNHLLRGVALVVMECLLLLCVSFLCGVRLATLTNGVIVLGLHGIAFVGGWIEQIAVATHSPRAVMVGEMASLIMPSETLWRRAAFEMQSALMRATDFSPFSTASVPSGAMIGYASVYAALALALAVRAFSKRDL